MAKKPEPQQTAVAEVPQNKALIEQQGFEEFAGAGLENVGASDILIPRLTILQALSPQLNPKKAEFVKDAKVGDICDVGTGEIFQEIVFLPVFYRKDYLEWAPRASGKGLVAVHTDAKILDACKRDEKNRPILDNGNYIAETAQMFGLNMSAQGRRSFVPMTSTQLRKARRWMTLATGERIERKDGSSFVPPLFYRTYLLSTADESNNEGEWAGWKIDRGQTIIDFTPHWTALRDECVAFMEQLKSGRVRGDVAEEEHNSSGSNGAEDRM